MDRELEDRRDLQHAPGRNTMGGELFTIEEKTFVRGPDGKPKVDFHKVQFHVPFGSGSK